MRDWTDYVRARLPLPALTSDRQRRVVREVAAQLEDFYREALAQGRSETDADAYARAQIRDWTQLARDVSRADRAHARPAVDRLEAGIDVLSGLPGKRAAAMADFLRDMHHGIRQLLAAPAFALVAILTMALGIGATSAIFSVVHGVILRPLPYPDPDTLVRVHEIVPQYGRFSVAPATFLDWRQQNGVFERIAAYSSNSVTYVGADGPERVQSAQVSWDLFDLLQVAPVVGRAFFEREGTPGSDAVVILSHGAWQRRFGGDPGVLGRTVTLSGAPYTIVGVMPSGFYFPSRIPELWTPLALNPATAPRGAHYLGVVARMRPGVTFEGAAAEMKGIAERLALQYPEVSANESAEVVSLHEQVVGGIRPALTTLFAAVAVVVLIACANVANLLLVRASVREREIAIRTALGAGRRRLAMQMLAESLVLSVAGGVLGLALAYLALQPIKALSAGSIPRVADIAIDGTVLLFAAAVSLVTGCLFGLAPAWQAVRGTTGRLLKEGGRGAAGAGGGTMRKVLLTLEVALSIVLLAGATLLLRSFSRLTSVNPGFDAEPVLTFQVALPAAAYPEPHNRVAFFTTLLERLESMPQVRAAGMTQALPLRSSYVLSFSIQGRPARPGEEPSANYRSVSPKYFAALGIAQRRGRPFTERDVDGAPMVAIVDEAFAHRHFPGEDPLGRRIDIGNGTDGFYEIVGLVGDVHHHGLDAAPTPTMYVPYRQDVFSSMFVVARTNGDPLPLAGMVRRTVREIDPALPAFGMGPLAEAISESVAERRFSMLLLVLFAGIAVFLAAVGVYGVVAYTVSQRTREIGVRMAIGAQPIDVVRLVVGGGVRLSIIGVALGLAAALTSSRLLDRMLFEVTPFDPASYATAAAVLLTIAALACYVPARRAMRVDPVVALRQE